jgi:hypothetical protein
LSKPRAFPRATVTPSAACAAIGMAGISPKVSVTAQTAAQRGCDIARPQLPFAPRDPDESWSPHPSPRPWPIDGILEPEVP